MQNSNNIDHLIWNIELRLHSLRAKEKSRGYESQASKKEANLTLSSLETIYGQSSLLLRKKARKRNEKQATSA